MTKEIGSEFWDIPLCEKKNNIFSVDTKWFLSGRIALQYIVRDSGIKSVEMPGWCCQSMIDPFLKYGVEVHFYEDCPTKHYDGLFVMDYFGFTDHSEVPADYHGIVIRDLTHSVFSKKYNDADYYFGSLRKWAGFKTGGFAFGNWKKDIPVNPCNEKYVYSRSRAMNQKSDYINGIIDGKEYLKLFNETNEILNYAEICGGYTEDIIAAEYFDVEKVKRIRRKNATVLINRIGCMFELKDNDCPLFVPILTERRNELRQYLIENNVYCPVHWPRNNLNDKELSLVCDQRYDVDDMNKICDLILSFKKE